VRNFLISTAIAGVIVATTSVVTLGTAQAAVITVTGSTTSLPSATKWGTYPGENTGGTTAITSTAAHDGNGSVELRGDRTRYQIGIQYAPFTTNLMALSSVSGLSFDWRIAGDSISGYNPDYTPALRLLVQDGNQRSELIWEGVYNGTYGNTSRDTWYSSTFDDNFYQFKAGSGVTLNNGSQVNQTLAAWITQTYSTNAFVSGISVGDGSGALATYHAFADDVSLRTTDGRVTTYNFEVASTAVPEPASFALLLAGFGATGMLRRRKAS